MKLEVVLDEIRHRAADPVGQTLLLVPPRLPVDDEVPHREQDLGHDFRDGEVPAF